MAMYFKTPFASGGDLAPIPTTIQPDGSVSYTEGFGGDYELELGVNPNALAVPRIPFNELFYQEELAIQQYQQNGTPDFITTLDNGGTPFPYSIHARVRYDDGTGIKLYESLVDANISLPSDATKWIIISYDDSTNVYITDATFGGSVNNNDVVAFSPITGKFEQSIASGTGNILQNAIGFADVTNSRVLVLGVLDGFSGLTPGAVYFVSSSTAGHIQTPSPTVHSQVGIALSATTLYVSVSASSENITVTYSTNSTFTVPPNVTTIFVSGCAGGGGGGGSGGIIAALNYPAAVGGGGGGGASQIVNQTINVTPGAVLTIVIGAGGAGGGAGIGNSVLATDGGNGGVTTLSSGITTLVTIPAGMGGDHSPSLTAEFSSYVGPGGYGGLYGGGSGSNGIAAQSTYLGSTANVGSGGTGGTGANNAYGIGGRGGIGGAFTALSNVSANGTDGENAYSSTLFGGGGGGGGAGGPTCVDISANGANGGNGAVGFLQITY